jgi:TRAP-type C4-dicarboxylate transport system substrate-binding protein
MKNISSLVAVAFGAAATLAFVAPPVQAEITLTYATNTAPTGLRGVAEKMFVDEITTQTNGEVKVRAFWGQSLLKGKEILKGVQDGVADMGHVNINYYPKRLLLNSGIMLFPEGPVKYDNKLWIYDRFYEQIPEMTREIEKYKQQIIYTYSVNPFSGTFTAPVNTMADFKGKRIRASSRWYLSLLEGLGATPVSVPWGDCYMALQTKALDSVFTNNDAIHRVKLDEVAPNLYIFEELWIPTPYLITINTKKWNRLPEKIRKGITKAAEVTKQKFTVAYKTMFNDIVAEQRKLGYKVKFATKKEIATFMALPEVEKNKATWAKEAKELGAANPEAVLKKIGSIIAEGIAREK